MKRVVPLWAAGLGWLTSMHVAAWAAEPMAPEVLGTNMHISSIPGLHEQLKAWLATGLEAEAGTGAVRTQVESLGAWGLDPSLLPDVVARVQSRQYVRGAWELNVSLSPASEAVRHIKPAVVRYRVSLLAPVWVLTGAVRKGDSLSCQLLQQDWRTEGMASKGGDALHVNWHGACNALAGSQARRPLQPGDVLKTADIAAVTAIWGQQEAMVVARQGGIQIEAKGMALADAQVGQRVPVRLNGQDRVVQGVVSAPGVIKVTEGL
jgi:flagella basal body P-ring formation protein FlgA